MFRILFINEVHQHVLRYRFSILMLVMFVLFSAAAVSFKPNLAKNGATSRVGDGPRAEPLFVLAQRTFDYQLRPNRLCFCVSGRLKYLPNRFTFGSMSSRQVSLGRRLDENVFFPGFPQLDWAFIINTLAAFMAIALTFDAICGDKEQGVLRLILSYPVPRAQLFLAKYVAALVTLLVPLLFAMLSSLLLIQQKGLTLTPSDYLAIGIIMLLSFLLLSSYILLGLLLSSRTARSEISLLLLAICFTLFVVLVPGFSTVLARHWEPLPSPLEIQNKIESIYEAAGRSLHLTQVDLRVRQITSNLREAYRQQRLNQAGLSTGLAFLSPNFIYQDACMDMAGYGLWRIKRTIKHLKQHVHTLDRFILEKDQSDPSSQHAGLIHYRTLSRKPVSLTAVPQFIEREPGIPERISHAAPNVVALLLLNLIFAFLAVISMSRYDAR